MCPPSSKARNEFLSDRQSICLSCAEPHSLGQFVSDWDKSLDACHQPDLAYLHGFYLSPSAFKVSQRLLPVFSQSKAPGFNDILYPSPWNYMDKVKYEPSENFTDPSYIDKEPTLFWRGATSEGFSQQGEWKGMTRQRLVHLANNHTHPVSVLLPSSSPPSTEPIADPNKNKNNNNNLRYTYQTLPGHTLPGALGLNTSIAIAENTVRCDPPDCRTQVSEFGTVERTDFQSHWKYRFLFDMDGAGFSGRFLPFLQSRSLPFRTALFRQWLDYRLVPWVHFVPQDLRLHGVWSTLAYFAGAVSSSLPPSSSSLSSSSSSTEPRVLMQPHHKEGEMIAEEGRKWAETTLRKEDMEIYLFRLLLEWGRLTDDRRNELGFSMRK